MRIFFITCSILAGLVSSAQEKSKTFYFKEIGWTITIPKHYKLTKVKPQFSPSTTILIHATYLKFNFFTATLSSDTGSYPENALHERIKQHNYQLISSNNLNAIIDSSSSIEMI